MKEEAKTMAEVKTAENRTLDVCKAVACLFIAATHIPSVFPNVYAEVYFGQWFFRFCVPFFFVCSGYFFYKQPDKTRQIRSMAWMTAFAYVLYLPQILEGADVYSACTVLIRNLILGYGHLWYLSAALEGMVIWFLLEKRTSFLRNYKLWVAVSVLLILLGGLLDEHFRVIPVPIIGKTGFQLLKIGGPRNVVFMGLPLLILGGALARYEERLRKIPTWTLVCTWVLLRGLALMECIYLFKRLEYRITMDVSFFGCWPGLVLFLLCDRIQLPISEKAAKFLRKSCGCIYVLHPLVATYLSRYLALPPLAHFACTILMSTALYILMEKQFSRKR